MSRRVPKGRVSVKKYSYAVACFVAMVALIFGARLAAQSSGPTYSPEQSQQEQMMRPPQMGGPMMARGEMGMGPERPRPNYELAAKFMPEKVGKLVFDTSVMPHWFELSDRFWYSYETPEGMHWWIVDPAKKTKTPLWNNAKIAVQLSTLTNFPFDAQHLSVRNLKLINKDTVMQFEVEVRKDSVIPNEPPKSAKDEEEQNQENVEDQGQQGGRRGGRGRGGEAATPGEQTRTLYFQYDLASGKVTRLDDFKAPPKKPTWASVSPDEKWVVFARGHNLYLMDAENYEKAKKNPADKSITETQLTTDGVEKYSYARVLLPEDQDQLKKDDKGDADNKDGMRTPPIAIHWSKDSKKIAVIREDDRKVADLWVIHTLANPRPILETYSYAMPGDDNVPIPEMKVIDIGSKQAVVVQAKNFFDQQLSLADAPITNKEREEQQGQNQGGGGFGGRGNARWLSDTSDKIYFTSMSRDFRKVDICVANTSDGSVKTLFQERANTWVDVRPLRTVNNGQQFIWWSERDGWGHYYLFDADGKLKNQITSGEWMADQIVSLDEKNGVMFFTGTAHEPNEDIYYDHLYRVNLDGSGLKLLSQGNASHAFNAADDGKYFVDTYSRVDTAPKSVLWDDQGNQVTELETTDISRLLDAGYKLPTTFHVKADDGITDLYGVMFKPFDFDPNKKYPVVLYVYPGPQTESVTKTFAAKTGADAANVVLAQMGIIVVEVGARGGSPQRDKWYDSYGYGNLRDYGLADKKAATEQLAAMYPFIDLNRVGIWGHSGGGFMSAAALLQYPDFFKAAWSESGNHDNNVYNKTWSEKYHGVREEVEKDGSEKFIYNIDKNSELAKNLKGHLMLTTGDMDNNVHMANTMRLADALIKADKRFEMLVFPGMRHPYTPINDYVILRRCDFFAHWLLGASEDGADIIELQRDKQVTPSKKFPE
jgi:dipeptidyl-peptidase 4